MILPLLVAVLPSLAGPVQEAPTNSTPPPPVYEFPTALAIEPLGVRRRSPVYTSGLEHARAIGLLPLPKEGSVLEHPDGSTKAWRQVQADEQGFFRDRSLRGGWLYVSVTLDKGHGGSFAFEARGHSFAFVDGYPRGGDVYGLGTSRLPMYLPEGTHDMYLRVGRPPVRARLVRLTHPIDFEEVDVTLPDVVREERTPLWMGQLISNASDRPMQGWSVIATPVPYGSAELPSPLRTSLEEYLPGTQRKQAIALPAPIGDPGETYGVRLQLRDASDNTVVERTVNLAVRSPWEKHKRTFRSQVDGSVQYYSVCPPPGPLPEGERPALILSLHGASVEATDQTRVYAPKDWAYIVAPTNRRPYGFDWEDWGRRDALEVLELAQERFGTDPDRTYLTGHSMGGHGTWQIGAHASQRFAAIAPSAGWKDFWSYAGGATFEENDRIGALFERAAQPSRTGFLRENYRHVGVSILHGDADPTVPVREARAMRDLLVDIGHKNFAYFERVGGNHWWADECVDWPPFFSFFQHNRRTDWRRALHLQFTSAAPSLRSEHGWLRVEQTQRAMDPVRLEARLQPENGTVHLSGENAERFQIDLRSFLAADSEPPLWPAQQDLTIHWLDTELRVPYAELQTPIALGPGPGGTLARRPAQLSADQKNPRRMGPFKAGLDHRMVFVYGSIGTPDENAWSLAKARFDHERWRYRGNGSIPLVRDVHFDPRQFPDRSVVLFGNQDTNAAWSSLLSQAPLILKRGLVAVGDTQREGEGLALLAVYPRPDSEVASVVVVGGTGQAGARLTDTLPYFVSGVAYPDWTVLDVSFLKKGLPGILGAGYFGRDWGFAESAESQWRTP